MIDPRIQQLHDEAPLVDLHAHPPVKLFLFEEKRLEDSHDVDDADDPFSMRVDLPSIAEGGVRVILATSHVPERQILPDCLIARLVASTNARARRLFNGLPDEMTREMLGHFEKAVSAAATTFSVQMCHSMPDLKSAVAAGKIAFLHAVEGGHSLRGRRSVADNIEDYADRGVCLLTLAHFYDHQLSPPVAGVPHDSFLAGIGCFRKALNPNPNAGLYPEGREAVRAMLEKGILVDLTHTNRKARSEIYKIWADMNPQYRRPLVFSHASLHEMAALEMNPDLDELDTIRQTGGVIGLIFMNYWHMGQTLKGEEDSFEPVVRAIDLLADKGFLDTIALGSDFDGFTDPPRGLKEPADMPNLTDELLTRRRYPGRRYSEAEVRQILGGNFMRALEAGWSGRPSRPPGPEATEAPRTAPVRHVTGSARSVLTALNSWWPGWAVADAAEAAPAPLDLEALREEMRKRPGLWSDHPPDFLGESVSWPQVEQVISSVAEYLSDPPAALESIAAVRASEEPSFALPVHCQFPGYDPAIPIRLGRIDVSDGDLINWATTWLASCWFRATHTKPSLPSHSDSQTAFSYRLRSTDGGPTLLLFSDWGTNYYHSRYIAKHIGRLKPDQAVHLGDVYYAGSAPEVQGNMEEALAPLLSTIPVHLLNANHEMMHHSLPLLSFMERKRKAVPNIQEQEGTYFSLENESYQVIAIDTDYEESGRCPRRVLTWLRDKLYAAKKEHKINVLLSQHEPYHRGATTALLDQDLVEFQSLVDLWFWGDEHYAALYSPGPQASFIGCCIGHGGYAFKRKERKDVEPPTDVARLVWWEAAGRFPAHLDEASTEFGNNGFAWLTLEAGRVTLKFIDWRLQLRYHTEIAVEGDRLYLPERPVFVGSPDGDCDHPVELG